MEHRFQLRLPRVLFVELSEAAYLNRRSVNAEILWRLGGGLSEGDGHSLASRAKQPEAVQSGRPNLSESSPSFKPDFGRRLKK